MGDALEKIALTLQDYLEIEKDSEEKLEYHFGEIFAMAGSSIPHGLLSTNSSRAISNALIKGGKPCRTYNSDVKIAISTRQYVYPDAFVVCGKTETYDVMPQAVKNPKLIVEVLSPSTGLYDMQGKFQLYQKIKSFQEYILISQDSVLVDVYFREPQSDFWVFRSYTSLDDVIYLKSVDVEITLADIYLDWEAPEEPTEQPSKDV